MEPKKTKRLKPECEQYSLDIIDLATNEKTFLSKERRSELLRHLVQCKNCREAFIDYENIYALTAAEERTKTPEFQKKMDDVIKRLRSEGTTEEKRETVNKIIRDAEVIFRHMPPDGRPIAVPKLNDKTQLPLVDFHLSLGWMYCKQWIDLKDNNRTANVLSQRTPPTQNQMGV